jgi:hypothetical protein
MLAEFARPLTNAPCGNKFPRRILWLNLGLSERSRNENRRLVSLAAHMCDGHI